MRLPRRPVRALNLDHAAFTPNVIDPLHGPPVRSLNIGRHRVAGTPAALRRLAAAALAAADQTDTEVAHRP